MRPGRPAAFGLWAALTFSSAVLVHGAVHSAGTRTFVWDSPAHVAMLAAALALLAGVAIPLGLIGPRRERRRRIALVRAGLGPSTPRFTALGVLLQIAIAASFLLAEGESLEPQRVVLALLCGLVALLFSAFFFRATRDRVVALLVALAAAVGPPTPSPTLRRAAPRRAAPAEPYRLFVPTRPPPSLAA